MRLTQALRHMYLPGIGKEVHPFIQALRTQEDQARVIQYIFKKCSKIRGGELRKDTFVHGDEDDLVGRVLRGEVVIMDEAEPRCWKNLESLVKVWGDRYPFIAEVKGSSKPICPEWFVVTSNYTLPQLTDAVNRPSFFSAMKRRAEDGRRVISMETLGEYRPKRMGPQLKEYERKAYEEVFQLFVKLVQGEFSVCCIRFFESQPCCVPTTMNGAEAHTLRTHATPSVAVILRALPAQCVLLGDNRALPCLAMHCRALPCLAGVFGHRLPGSLYPSRLSPTPTF